MAQRRIDFLSLMYKKSSDPGNSPTASRQLDRRLGRRPRRDQGSGNGTQDRDDAYAARRYGLGDRVIRLAGRGVADADRECRDPGRRGQR